MMVTMQTVTTTQTTPRCPVKACPVRWRDGADRRCADHADDDGARLAAAALELGIDLAPPGRFDPPEPSGDDPGDR